MSKKKHAGKLKRPCPIPITRDRSVPTNDFFDCLDLDTPYGIDEALINLIGDLKSDYFLLWEAVVCEENRLPLTKKQKKALNELISFGDEWDERILYINEIPRPREQWYEIARKVISLLVEDEPFDTTEGMSESIYEGWPEFLEVFKKHAKHLSLPEAVESPLEIFQPEILHRLNLQLCLDSLSGLGQMDDLTLENEEQQFRIESLINCLNEHKEMVRYFELTLESLSGKVKMPAKDETVFIDLMLKQLGLPSQQAHLIDFLVGQHCS